MFNGWGYSIRGCPMVSPNEGTCGYNILPADDLPHAATRAVYMGLKNDAITTMKTTGSKFYKGIGGLRQIRSK
jgi:hypothetical protein